jgi:hypothetical protein
MNTHKKYNIEKLLFRRQFVLGPRFIEDFPHWSRVKIRDNYFLTVHPDLKVTQIVREEISLTLLGYILDPYHPQATDHDILSNLIGEMLTDDAPENFIKCTYGLGGRWILIAGNVTDLYLFNDASGYRQVHYTDAGIRDFWCSSTPGLIADILNLKIDATAAEFINAYMATETQYWWPGASSLYREIRHLLPNHYLNLRTGSCIRYWPKGNIDVLSLQEVVELNEELLKGLMKSASNRYDLAVSLTAGRDTRLILAASRDVCDQLLFFTLQYWDLTDASPDLVVPPRLSSKLNLKHMIIKCPSSMEDTFRMLYERNVTTARQVYGTIAQGMFNCYPHEKVCVKGNSIPITKSHYRHKLHNLKEQDNNHITADTLALLTKRQHPFAINEFNQWLSGIPDTNIDVLDLFSWEDRIGNWQAMSQSEWDIVQEVFVPFNCRSFLSNMLSADKQYRQPPEYILQEKLIKRLWQDVLCEPINPIYEPIGNNLLNTILKTRIHTIIPQTLRGIVKNLLNIS